MAAQQSEIEMEKRQPENAAPPHQTPAGPSDATASPAPVSGPQEQGVTPVNDAQASPISVPPQTHQAVPPPYHEYKQQPPQVAGQPMVPMVVPLQMLQGEAPQWIDCPFCHQRALTETRREGTSMQMLTGVLLCLLCVCLACLPCCAGWFEDTLYSCSACKKLVAKRFDDGGLEVYGPPVVVPSQYPK
ncbi:hypothetical protein QBC47DRAFT_118024 [Echria macrotheca]|uniref:LITAF domain-containing protein n=1 Tax=Echria macrotheca TaxID=438768 RepID=A0AAJ0BQ43_9PEZI|nr:hypothetical protein QBC47DRAFT_118024 [Echria macrotheca]